MEKFVWQPSFVLTNDICVACLTSLKHNHDCCHRFGDGTKTGDNHILKYFQEASSNEVTYYFEMKWKMQILVK